MALQINNFTGFETQGNEEAAATTGSPSYPTTGQRSGNSNLRFTGADAYVLPWVANVSDAGANYIFRFAFKIDTSIGSLCFILDDTGSAIFDVRIVTGGNLTIRDANASDLDTSSATYNDGSWHTVTVYAALNSASADWEWFIDGTSEGSGSGADLTDGNAFGSSSSGIQFQGSSGITKDFDDVYILSGATAASDRLSDCEVFGYQNGAGNTATPDGGLSGVGTSGGDALDTGTWDIIDDTPRTGTDSAQYTAAGAGSVDTDHSTRGGPSGDSNVDGDSNIKAIKGVWRLERNNGAGTTHSIGMGDSGDTDVAATTVSLNTAEETFEWLRETNLPTASQFIRQGFGRGSGGRDILCHEMWAMVLHVPSAGGVQSGVGAAAGTGAATGVGASTAAADGSAAGAGTATAVGTAIHSGVGSAAGAGDATGVGLAISIQSGVGSADGVGAATAVGESTAAGAGSSDGVASVSGAGASTHAADGTAAGVAAATAVGTGIKETVGSAAGTGAASGVGIAISVQEGAGSAAGAGTATGVGESTAAGAGASDGVASVSGVGASTHEADGSAAGVGAASAVGTGIKESVGSSDGVATATGVGASIAAGVGDSAGTSTATAVGESTHAAVGSAAGVGTATGISPLGDIDTAEKRRSASALQKFKPGVTPEASQDAEWRRQVGRTYFIESGGVQSGAGSAAGTGTATGIGASTHAAVGSSAGVGAATAVGRAIKETVGSAAGTSAATAVGESTFAGVGNAAGVGTASAVGVAQGDNVGNAAGVGTATGVGTGIHSNVGAANGTSTAAAVGSAVKRAAASSICISTASGVGAAIAAAAGSSAGVGAASGVGESTHEAMGLAAGLAAAAAVGALVPRGTPPASHTLNVGAEGRTITARGGRVIEPGGGRSTRARGGRTITPSREGRKT